MTQKETQESSGYFKIHNVSFYNVAPRQIKCLSYNKKTFKLAVSRDDASIEIWDMKFAAYMEKCILGRSSSSVEGLGWLENRLFSTGLNGELIEWNLKELKPKITAALTGNGGCCMDIDNVNSCIAVGTNEGHINTFKINGDDVSFTKLLDKQEGGIFCCKYDSKGDYIVAGSSDVIRIWNAANGHAMHRMSVGRSENKAEANVWSLVVLKDLTIIAGDSRGIITVWNGKNGTRIDSINALDADVYAVAVNDGETKFCCSGVDPKIKIYISLTKEKETQRRWIDYIRRSDHDHDVKALTFIDEERIVSGGVDGYINVTQSEKIRDHNRCQYGPFLPQPCAVVAMSARLLLLKHFNYLEVWRLGHDNDNIQLSDDDDSRHQRKFFSMEKEREKLLLVKSPHEEPITCASISPDGMFLVYSTDDKIRLYQLDIQPSGRPSAAEVTVTSDRFTACAKVMFSTDSKFIYCVKNSGDIDMFSVPCNDDVDFKATIRTKEYIKDTVSLVCLSKCGRYLVCAGVCGTTIIWKYDAKRNQKDPWQKFNKIPTSHSAPTAMAIDNKSSRIVLAFSDYRIFSYDLTNGAMAAITTKQQLFGKKDESRRSYTAINNILLDESNENVVIFQNDSSLFVLKKDKASNASKKAKTELPSYASSSGCYKLIKSIENYKHFVHLSWLSPSEIVAITVNPVALLEQLPPSMRQKRFGIS